MISFDYYDLVFDSFLLKKKYLYCHSLLAPFLVIISFIPVPDYLWWPTPPFSPSPTPASGYKIINEKKNTIKIKKKITSRTINVDCSVNRRVTWTSPLDSRGPE